MGAACVPPVCALPPGTAGRGCGVAVGRAAGPGSGEERAPLGRPAVREAGTGRRAGPGGAPPTAPGFVGRGSAVRSCAVCRGGCGAAGPRSALRLAPLLVRGSPRAAFPEGRRCEPLCLRCRRPAEQRSAPLLCPPLPLAELCAVRNSLN